MSSLDLDHTFVKAIHLLHSKSKESLDVLKQMYDDAVALKLGMKASSTIIKQDNIFPPHRPSPKFSSTDANNVGTKSKKYEEISRKHELGKRSEKFQSDSDPGLLPSESKRLRLDSPRVSPGQSPIPNRNLDSTPPPISNVVEEKIPENVDDLDGNTDADEFAREMGLVCVVCRQIDVAPGNQLIECQECHNLYHQECHRPPATDHDVKDPRLVWYCTKCKKNLKKIATVPKPQKLAPKQPPLNVVKDNTSFNKAFKSDSYSSLQLPFKRVESKTSTSTSSTNKPIGLAGLAANLNNKSSSSSSSISTSKSLNTLKLSKSSSSATQSLASNPIKGLASLALSLKPSSSSKSSSEKSDI